MRGPGPAIAVVVALAAGAPISAQTEFEMRGASTQYRLAGVSYTHPSGLVLDALYVGVPEVDQAYLGAGYEFAAGRRLSLVPILYGVSGNDTRGVALGLVIAADGRLWNTHGFLGRFFRTDLGTADYTFIDALEVTRAVGSWDAGVLIDVYAIEDERGWLAGPLVKRNDAFGAWGLAVRTGDENEVRLIRTVAF